MTKCKVHVLAVLLIILVLVFSACAKHKHHSPRPGPFVTITFVGDTGEGDQAQEFVAQYGLHKSFENVRAALKETDFLIGNGETPIADETAPPLPGQPWHPKQVPATAKAYADEGFTAFSLANNHCLDYGVAGMQQTIKYLADAGVKTFGAGMYEAEARRPLILEKNGIKVGILGYFEQQKKYVDLGDWFARGDQPGVAELSEQHLRADIAAIKKQVDVVVVFPHWGVNYRPVTKVQRELAPLIVDAGAILIVGSGSHTAQDVAVIKKVPVLYSLGNFIWHSQGLYKKSKMEDFAYTLVARIEIDRQGVRRILLTPFLSDNRKVNFVSQPVSASQAKKLFASILRPLNNDWELQGSTAVIDLQ
jgi:poly-gamma-glutamate capsule biosynthesis protein CapA/YwtB (metallophosphatase superfamily)